MFINHPNHASAKWSATQAEAARAWGAIEDLPFPDVGADWDEERVARLAEENAAKILAKEPRAVLCQGEFTYVHHLVNLLLAAGVTVLAATSRREVNEEQAEDGSMQKISRFVFTRFREYRGSSPDSRIVLMKAGKD